MPFGNRTRGMALDYNALKGTQSITDILTDQLPKIAEQNKKGLNKTSITIKQCGLDHAGCTQLADAFSDMKITLSSVDVSCNNIWEDGCEVLCRLLESPTCSIEELNFQDNHLGDKGAISVAAALRKNTTVRVLNLGQNAIGDEGVEALCESLVFNTSVRVLDLSNNKIGERGALNLANMMGGLGINIHGVKVEEEEEEDDEKGKKKKLSAEEEAALEAEKARKAELRAEAEAKLKLAATPNISIESLDVGGNEIPHTGLTKLAEGIRKHPQCLNVICTGNKSDSSVDEFERKWAMDAVAEAVAYNHNLRVGVVKLALFMGLHPRVGSLSSLKVLQEDAVKMSEPKIDIETGKLVKGHEASVLNGVWDFLGPPTVC